MNLIISVLVMIFGIIVFYITYKDGKKRKAEFTTGYFMHVEGYLAGVGFFVLGIIMFFKNFG